jgi:hypothetical protein
MRTASCLTLIAVGAIFTFAITSSPSFLNLQIAGVIIMLTGVAGLVLPRPSTGWLRRRTILRRSPRGPVVGTVDEQRYPPYVMLNPGADPGPKDERQPGDFSAEEEPTETVTDVTARDVPSQRRGTADDVTRTESEVVDEYIEE